METKEALERALDQTGRVVAAITPDQYDQPTPCKDFDVRALLNHTVASLHTFAAAARTGEHDFSGYGKDMIGGDPAGAYREKAKELAAAVKDDADEQSMATPIIEVVTHGWDLAKATGQDAGFDDDLSMLTLDLARKYMPPDGQRPDTLFADSVPVGDAAPAHDQLAAFLGRTP